MWLGWSLYSLFFMRLSVQPITLDMNLRTNVDPSLFELVSYVLMSAYVLTLNDYARIAFPKEIAARHASPRRLEQVEDWSEESSYEMENSKQQSQHHDEEYDPEEDQDDEKKQKGRAKRIHFMPFKKNIE